MMIPEPWFNHESMSDEKKAFYEFHSSPYQLLQAQEEGNEIV